MPQFMTGLVRLQLVGPVSLCLVVLAAEGSACALASAPASPTLWYLNLTWFGVFQSSHYLLNEYVDVPYFQLLGVALPLLAAALAGAVLRVRLLLGIASNLSLLYAAFVLAAWHLVNAPRHAFAAGPHGGTAVGTDGWLLVLLAGLCLMSSVASHAAYLRASRAEAMPGRHRATSSGSRMSRRSGIGFTDKGHAPTHGSDSASLWGRLGE